MKSWTSVSLSVLLLSACHDGGGESFVAIGGGSRDIPVDVLTAGVWDDNLNYGLFESYVAATSTVPGAPEIEPAEQDRANARFLEREPRSLLDVALVIDTTSSMSDEIAYLEAEFRSLVQRLEQAHPEAQQRWALVSYGDDGDDYVVKTTDFTDDTDTFIRTLKAQGATRGGDYPEASDRALGALGELSWRENDTAKLAFWLADAPHHERHSDRMLSAIRIAAQEDLHIYPIAASGADALTEYTMRAAAQLTGGRFMFLTDDSGIGAPHLEPTIPCFFVTLLSDAVLRVVDIELTGSYREPDADQIIRVGGNPMNGQCTLQDGSTVGVF